MEEDIKILESYLNGDKIYDTELDNALRNLIARYKEVEEDLQNNKDYIKELQKKLTNAIEIKYIHQDYIPKSKVKEKIEELKQDVKDFEEYWSKDPRRFKRQQCIDYYKLEALQELLED